MERCKSMITGSPGTPLAQKYDLFAASNLHNFEAVAVNYGHMTVSTVIKMVNDNITCTYCGDRVPVGCVMFRAYSEPKWSDVGTGQLDSYIRCCKDCAQFKRYGNVFVGVRDLRKLLVNHVCSGTCQVVHMTLQIAYEGNSGELDIL
jgi:hypothetical protein